MCYSWAMTTLTYTKKQAGVLKALATNEHKTKGITVADMLATKKVKGAPSGEEASLYPIVRGLVTKGLVKELLVSEGETSRGNRYTFRLTAAGKKALKGL